jgi:protein-S-isoprenylcysteine O-methyltransferase Ste14
MIVVPGRSSTIEMASAMKHEGGWRSYLMRVPVPWVFVLAYLAGVLLERLCPSHIAPAWLDRAKLAGVLLFALGLAIALWAQVLFRRRGTTTVPGEKSVSLVTSGPYSFTRNPMYVGLTLAYIGEAGILGQLWPLALLPLVVLYLDSTVIPVEERRLMEVFGQAYERYRAKVRRWI